MAEDNFTSFTFGSSGMRVVRPGRVDPPNDPEWYLPSTPIDGQANTIETILTSIDDLRGLTTTLSGFLPENLQPDQYLRVNPAGDEIVYSPLDLDNIVTDYISLSDTPADMSPGSYLRINSAGDAVEHVLTAPPDGGTGDNSSIQAASKFGGKLPDAIVIGSIVAGEQCIGWLHRVNSTQIMYQFWTDSSGPSSHYLYFDNDTTGSNAAWGGNTSHFRLKPDEDTLQKIIDAGNAIYHGQKSGTSGAGSLSVIKSQAEQFYTELPDAIVATVNGGYETILRLKFARNITDQSDGQNFYYEARVQGGSTNDYIIIFKDDADGTFMGHGGETDNFPADGSTDQNLRWFIENGRALYHGESPRQNLIVATGHNPNTQSHGSRGIWVTNTYSDITNEHAGSLASNGVFTAPRDMTVIVNSSASMHSSNTTSSLYIRQLINDATVMKSSDTSQDGAVTKDASVTGVYALSTGDTLSTQTLHYGSTSSASINNARVTITELNYAGQGGSGGASDFTSLTDTQPSCSAGPI